MEQLCITLVGEGSYPLAIGPTLGTRFGLSQVYHPSQKGGLCTRPTAVDKRLNTLDLDIF